MKLFQKQTSPFNIHFDSRQPNTNFDYKTCQNEAEIRSQCDTFIGSGAGGVVLGSTKNKQWVFRLSKMHNDNKGIKTYKKIKTAGKCPQNIRLLTAKQLFMQNWTYVKQTPSSCLPVVHNFIEHTDNNLVGIIMERLESFENTIGKKAFKNTFMNIITRFILSAGMVFQKNGLTQWDITSNNICIKSDCPQQRFLVNIPALPVDMEIDMPEGNAMVMIDFDDCSSQDDHQIPCTSPSLNIPDYYRPYCSVIGWCRTLILRLLLTNDRTTRIIWRSQSLLKTMMIVTTVFFPEAALWVAKAQECLVQNNMPDVINNMTLAFVNINIQIYNYNKFETESAANFVQKCVILNERKNTEQEFWKQFITMLQDSSAPKIHFKSHFVVSPPTTYMETEHSHFGLLVVQMARRLGLGVRMHIPTVTKGDRPFSEASSTISIIQSTDFDD
jgi:hypothetical protein